MTTHIFSITNYGVTLHDCQASFTEMLFLDFLMQYLSMFDSGFTSLGRWQPICVIVLGVNMSD